MIRFLLSLVIVIIFGALALLYFGQATPEWYDPSKQKDAQQGYQELKSKYAGSNGSKLIESKVRQLLFGELKLSEEELNAIVFATLQGSEDGRRLLSASDGLNVQIKQETVEVGVILNLDKAAKVDKKMKKYVAELRDKLPFIRGQHLHLAIESLPSVANGQLLFDKDMRVKIGRITLSKKRVLDLMSRVGAKPDKLKQLRIKAPNVYFNQVAIVDSQLKLGLNFR